MYEAPISHLENTLTTEYFNHLRIVMVGKTGSGKSATGNSLLGKDLFQSKLGAQSVTRECVRKESNRFGRDIIVVDTPGLFDTQLSPVEIDEHIIKCVHLSYPGPHAFLIVLQIGRFTEEEVNALNRLFDIFGDTMGSCSILIFTGYDNLEREGKSIRQYIDESGEQLQKYIANCGGRYFAVNNIESIEKKEKTAKRLLLLIETMLRKNGGKHFTNRLFENVGSCLEDKIKQIKEKEEQERTKQLMDIDNEYQEKISKVRDERKYIGYEAVSVERMKEQIYQKKIEVLDSLKNDSTVALEDQSEKSKEANDLEEEERKIADRLMDIKSKKSDMDHIYDQIQQDKLDKMSEIDNLRKKDLAKALDNIFEDNCKTMNSIFEALHDIDKELHGIRAEMADEKNVNNHRLQKHHRALEKKLMKMRSQKVKKQSKHFVQLMNNSIHFQKQLTKKKVGICSVM